jgi:shikimate kinase
LLGGIVFTDNTKFKLIKHSNVPKELGSTIAILIPDDRKMLTSSIDSSAYEKYRVESLNSFDYSLKGEFASAMMLNSIIQCAALKYSIEPVSTAMAEGASAAGITGKGPAVAALCRDSKTLRRVKKAWLEEDKNCSVLETTVVQPEETIR